jgi:hypothetical protein
VTACIKVVNFSFEEKLFLGFYAVSSECCNPC